MALEIEVRSLAPDPACIRENKPLIHPLNLHLAARGARPYITQMFAALAHSTARMIGHPFAFAANVGIILLWAVSGPVFHFSDTWQLVVNTGTTVFTYLMLFLLQNSQNRDGEAIQKKLDEILRALPEADDALRGIENDPGA